MMYDEDYYLESVLFPWLDDGSMEDFTEDPYYEAVSDANDLELTLEELDNDN